MARLGATAGLVWCSCQLATLGDGVLYRCGAGGECEKGQRCWPSDGLCHPESEAMPGGSDAGDAGAADGGEADGGAADAGCACLSDAGARLCGSVSGCGCGDCPATETCGGSGTPNVCALDTSFCSSEGWCWDHPKPQGNHLRGAYAVSPSDVWVVGSAGTILRWNGTLWYRMRSPVQKDLHAVWASGPNDVWIAGQQGTRLRFDGTAWEVVNDSINADLEGVWGFGPGDVWVVGNPCLAAHLEGGAWTTYGISCAGAPLRSLWGSGQNLLFAVGGDLNRGVLVGFDGGWTPPLVRGGGSFHSVHGAAGRLFVAADDGLFELADGGFSLVAGGAFYGVAGNLAGVLWAVGANGVVGRLGADGGWNAVDAGPVYGELPDLGTVVISSGPDAIAAGQSGALCRLLGGGAGEVRWVSSGIPHFLRSELNAVWGSDSNLLWVVGGRRSARRFGSGDWVETVQDMYYPLALAGIGPGEVWAASTFGSLFTWSPASESWLLQFPDPQGRGLSGVAASSAQDVRWVAPSDPRRGGPSVLGSMSDAGWRIEAPWAGVALDAGLDAGLLPDGGIDPDGGVDLWAIAYSDGAYYLAGDGVILSERDGGWSLEAQVPGKLRAVWAHPSLAIAVGNDGLVMHRAGGSWVRVDAGTAEHLVSVSGRSASEAYAAGGRGLVLRWDGKAWRTYQPMTDLKLRGVYAVPDGGVFAVGDKGAVLRRR